MIKNLLLWIIGCYRRYLSPMMAPRCRFYPTCSSYGRQALLWHGAAKGTWLTLGRIARCHPWGGSGVDFVPLPLDRYQYLPTCHHWQLVYQDRLTYAYRLNLWMNKAKD